MIDTGRQPYCFSASSPYPGAAMRTPEGVAYRASRDMSALPLPALQLTPSSVGAVSWFVRHWPGFPSSPGASSIRDAALIDETPGKEGCF